MAITTEQQQALDELFNVVQANRAAPAPQPVAPVAPAHGLTGDWWPVLQSKLAELLQSKDRVEHTILDTLERNPLDSAVTFLATASAAFYAAEMGVNPKIKTYIDAFYYIATCASVGYADIFAATQTGRAIAGLVMIVGPALTSRALDRPARAER